jgi:integrase
MGYEIHIDCAGQVRLPVVRHLYVENKTEEDASEHCDKGEGAYLQQRRPYAPFDDHLFISLRRKPLLIEDADTAFRTVTAKMGLPQGRGQRRPTLHSLRHAFAVRALKTCPDGRNHITKHMLMLSTYLGHMTGDN